MMGVSTDGILVYGMDLSQEDEGYSVKVPWAKDKGYESDEEADTDDDATFEGWWAKENGVSSATLWEQYYAWEKNWKTGEYTHDKEGVRVFEKAHPGWREALDRYYKDYYRVEEECPVEEITHCSYEFPMYILAVKDHAYRSSRGYPVEVDSLDVDEAAAQRAKEFCKKYGIRWEPKWYLVSLWA